MVESVFGRDATGDQNDDQELKHDNLRNDELEKMKTWRHSSKSMKGS